MDRKNFLTSIGGTAACICMGGLAACVKATTIPSGSNNNLSIDLNTQLVNIGDYVVLGAIAVVRIGPGTSNSSFAVLSTICPHQGFTVQYLPDALDPTDPSEDTKGIFRCPGHGSEFTKQGNLISGLATMGLSKYPFSITNNTLVIFTT
jgi:cytochrome b6-f complex iron-sulfur subunit